MSRFLTVLLLVVPFIAPAQSKEDHLAAGLAREEEGYLDTALKEYRLALPLAGAMNGIASIEVANGDYDSVLIRLQESRGLDDSPSNLIKNYQVEAKYWQAQNEYDQAVSLLHQALDLAVETKSTVNRAIILSSIGSVYFSHDHDMNNVRDFYQRSNALCDTIAHANIVARNYARIANTYLVEGDGIKAKHYLDRAKKISDKSGNLPLRAYVLSSIAIILFDEHKYKECIELMQEPIRINRELGHNRKLQNDLLNVSEMYMMTGNYEDAAKALDEGLSISKSLGDIVYMKYFYDRASLLDSARGDYKSAYANMRRAMKYRDSAFSAERVRDVKDIQQKYEAEQKEKVIAEKEVALAVTLGSSIIVVLLLLMILIVVRARNRRQRNQLRLTTIVKTQEEVQQRIARDLHDGLVQVLGAAKMSLQSVSPGSDREVVQKHIHNASSILDEAVNETRAISHQLLPYPLLKNGLVPALEDLFARSLSDYEFEHDDINVSEEISINTYRIIQELVNNVQKHAPSSQVLINLEVNGNELELVFADNGPGYDLHSRSNGAGLANMQARAEMMNAKLVLHSGAGEGTRTELTIPL